MSYISPVLSLDISGPEHTRALALALAPALHAGDLLLLSGELGAGKTTFTRSLGEGLGVREGVISPTFVLSRVHPNLPDGLRPGGPDLVHVDAYRLSSAEELDDLDLEFSMDSSVTVIEWGHGKAEHLSDSRLELDFTRLSGEDADSLYAGGEEFSWDDEEENESDSDLTDVPEPRLLRIQAFGPRWQKSFEQLDQSLSEVQS